MRVFVNISLLPVFIVLAVSGIKAHTVSRAGVTSNDWVDLHFVFSIIFTVLIVIHIVQHKNWFKNFFRNIMKSKTASVLLILNLLLLITGVMLVADGSKDLKDMHNMVGMISIIFSLIHIVMKFKWYLRLKK